MPEFTQSQKYASRLSNGYIWNILKSHSGKILLNSFWINNICLAPNVFTMQTLPQYRMEWTYYCVLTILNRFPPWHNTLRAALTCAHAFSFYMTCSIQPNSLGYITDYMSCNPSQIGMWKLISVQFVSICTTMCSARQFHSS